MGRYKNHPETENRKIPPGSVCSYSVKWHAHRSRQRSKDVLLSEEQKESCLEVERISCRSAHSGVLPVTSKHPRKSTAGTARAPNKPGVQGGPGRRKSQGCRLQRKHARAHAASAGGRGVPIYPPAARRGRSAGTEKPARGDGALSRLAAGRIRPACKADSGGEVTLLLRHCWHCGSG